MAPLALRSYFAFVNVLLCFGFLIPPGEFYVSNDFLFDKLTGGVLESRNFCVLFISSMGNKVHFFGLKPPFFHCDVINMLLKIDFYPKVQLFCLPYLNKELIEFL